MNKHFFEESGEQSIVKTTIVQKYFFAWARIVTQHAEKIAYFDLFAGPGRYADGTKSTPLMILEEAINNEQLSQKLVVMLNDKNSDYSSSLQKEIEELPGIDNLKYRPKVFSEEVGSEMVQYFNEVKLIPSLFFIDPWGYKGLSIDLVNALIKDWASDCIFFFNYNRISMGISNRLVRTHMESLFGEDKVDELAQELDGLSSSDRELTVIEKLTEVLNPHGKRFVLPFRFRDSRGTRTSHHLIFVSKNARGYQIMKDIMAKESSSTTQGVPSFEYNPADHRYPVLFELSRPLEELGELLLMHFSGRTATVGDIFEEHNIGCPFIKKNYKDAIKELEGQGKIDAAPSAECRRKGTCADHVKVTFPQID